MNSKRLIANVFEQGIADATGERVLVELVDGPGKGAGLRGCVAWTGDAWRILADKNVTDWTLWKNCWHEWAHVHFGDVPRIGTATFADDRRLITGGPKTAPATWAGYLDNLDTDAEDRADRFALRNARDNLDALNAELAKPQPDAAKRINQRYGVDTSTRSRTKVVWFKEPSAKALPATGAIEREIQQRWPDVERGTAKWEFLKSVLTRRHRYIRWVQELLTSRVLVTA